MALQGAGRPPGTPATSGTATLTRREAEVFAALAGRPTNAELAVLLSLSERTVESHVSAILRKVGATNRAELAELARAGAAATHAMPPALEQLADGASFIGRTDERERLRAAWKRAADGRTLVVAVAGEAGIGKSRLVAELASEVHSNGARVLIGGCFEDVPRPYAPLVQAIADDAASLSDDELQRRVGNVSAWVRIVPTIAARIDAPPATEVFDPAMAQLEVLEGLHGYLRQAAENAPTLVIIEDIHWATAATLSSLRHIARASGYAPLLVVVTTRDVPPDFDDAVSLFLADLARLSTSERIDLAGLSAGDVAALLDGQVDADARSITMETGGNPLLVQEIASGRRADSGTSLEGLLARRYALLDSEALLVLEVASVLGSVFSVDLLASAAARPVLDVYDALEHARAAGLVRPAARTGSFSFVHALFRTARYAAIPPGRRLRLHAEVVRAIEALPDAAGSIVELARHSFIAAPVGNARRAMEHSIAAARLAEGSLALAEAADRYRDAMHCAELLDPSEPALQLEVRTRLGEMLQGAGSPEYHRVLSEAADLARSHGASEALAEVGWALVRYGGPRVPGSPDQLLLAGITRDVLGSLGHAPTATCARTLAAASEDLCLTDPARGAAVAEEALAIARAVGDPMTLGHVLLSYRVAARTPENTSARHATADELIDIGERTGQSIFCMLGLVAEAWNHREAGELDASDVALAAGTSLHAEELLPPTYRTAVTLFRASQQSMHGRLDEAERSAESIWGFARGFDPVNWYGPAVLLIRHSQGRIGELLSMIESAALQAGVGEVYRAALAVAYGQAGRTPEALAIVQRLTADHLAVVPRNFTWLASVVALTEAAELTGDRAAAEELLLQLEPYAGWIADLPQTVVAPVDLALAQAALTTGAYDRAVVFAARAVEASRRRDTPIFLGRELVRLAAATRAAGGADVDQMVAEALAIADRTGAELIRHEAQRLELTTT